MDEALDPAEIAALRALVDIGRLRILGLLAGGPMTREELASTIGTPAATLIRPLEQLIAAELVEARPGAHGARPGATGARPGGRGARFAIRGDRIGALARRLATLDRGTDRADEALASLEGIPAEDAKVLRGYLEDGRLTTIPAQASKRAVVLRWLLDRVFTEDREYPEKEVNQLIALVHPDAASLRRYLVDAGLVRREAGRYRRVTARSGAAVDG
jgi:DNA-binding transcriptional ArsR family regulator